MTVADEAVAAPGRRRIRITRSTGGRVGLVLLGLLLLLAFVGPAFAPHPPSQVIGIPYGPPGPGAPLGTDFLGRDVLSRVLHGGRTVIGLAAAATTLGYVVGLAAGLLAGFVGSWVDGLTMRLMDVLLAFPPILFLLVLAAGAGSSVAVLIIGVATIHVPQIARIVRTATLETTGRGYVEAAVARGDSTGAVLVREILPNISGPVLADLGIRITVSILLVASINFLGLGLHPPTADWALMISENRNGIAIQPWAVAVPAMLLALLTVSVNLVADGIARSLGRSVEGLARA
jgi:ABC-type dipeptide/oligopeptide/nickel transport system permease subunit